MKLPIKPLSLLAVLFSIAMALGQAKEKGEDKKPPNTPPAKVDTTKVKEKENKDSEKAAVRAQKKAKVDLMKSKMEKLENERHEKNRSDLESRAAANKEQRNKMKTPMPVKQ